jgi:RNA polymerase sigma-70 factor (ECF subfamily)
LTSELLSTSHPSFDPIQAPARSIGLMRTASLSNSRCFVTSVTSNDNATGRLNPPARQVSTDMLMNEAPSGVEREADQHRALVEAARNGDRKAAEALLRALLPRIRNLVRYFVRGDSDVDDLAQEALVAVLKGLSGYRGEGSVKSWVDRITVRTVFAHIRRARVSEQRHTEYTPDLAPVSDATSAQTFLARRRAVRALDDVPNEQRQVLVLHHVVGLGVREIAEELSVPFETVRSRLRLGMARLRVALGADEEPEARSS